MDDCDDREYESAVGISRVFRGTYSHGFEHSAFVPDGSPCRWWLSGELGSLREALPTADPHRRAAARVEVEGTLTPPGCYGHMGAARRQLQVTRVLAVEILPAPTVPPGE